MIKLLMMVIYNNKDKLRKIKDNEYNKKKRKKIKIKNLNNHN